MNSAEVNTAKYSVLIAGEKVSEEEIRGYLLSGLKVILFCDQQIYEVIKLNIKEFIDAGFAEVYVNANGIDTLIVDGIDVNDNIGTLSELEEGDPRFNLDQFVIEHQAPDINMIIEAGAGTGKTHVMINRIMYLMHVDESFDFSKVAMITFTNKATDNMRHRLVNTLNAKYKLTGNPKYLDKIEQLAQINISTIHSFFKKVIVEIGPTLGYGTNIQLKSYIYEKRELLRDLMDKHYKGSGRVRDAIGLPVHKIEELALQYWEKLDNNGLSEEEIITLDWGTTTGDDSKRIQETLKDIFSQVDAKYNEIKYINNAISMKDIIHELSRVIHRPELKDYITNNYRYMFCDEFQDSDNVQIQTIAVLNRVYNGNLFVVGDIKQSIYRFRGATDSAFRKLDDLFDDHEKSRLVIKSLTKNYRTSHDILNVLDSIFQSWGSKGMRLLQYESSDRLVPQVHEGGCYCQISIKKGEREKAVIDTIRKIHTESEHKKITVLARKNSELRTVKAWCEKEKIVCLIRERGSFYESDAVLDFCALVEAYLYDNEPMYLFNYIASAYGSGTFDYEALRDCNGDKGKVFSILLKQINVSEWEKNRKELRNKPVMSVLRRIVSEKTPTKNYGLRKRDELVGKGYPLEKAVDQAVIDMTQYEANLKKLLQLMTDQFSGDFCSLLDICNYIRNRIMTDKEEEPAEVNSIENIEYVEGLTVHAAKGLEFENVLIPYMNDTFYQSFRSEILVSRDHKKVGWVYREQGKEDIKSQQYDLLIHEELDEVAKEETRLLYVAMTRAIYGLYCFVERRNHVTGTPSTWAELLPEVRDNA